MISKKIITLLDLTNLIFIGEILLLHEWIVPGGPKVTRRSSKNISCVMEKCHL